VAPGWRQVAAPLLRAPGPLLFERSRAASTAFFSDFEQGEIGPDLFRHACLMELEGLVSKRTDRRYRGGRSADWIKMKNRKHPAMNRVKDSFS
jgi:bifunctional non-homologous end joining protein LigD